MKKIIYPEKTSRSLTIGVTAPSSGLGIDTFIKRFELVAKEHSEKEIKIIEGHCLRKNEHFVSGTGKERAEDFTSMWNDSAIDLIQPPWGGEYLIDMLEYLDFEALKMNPTWVQGYSDISTLLFAITTKTGIATAHGTNFLDFINGQDELTSSSRDYLGLKEGDFFIQKSSNKWQSKFINFSDNLSTTFNLNEKTYWKVLNGNGASIEGRIIGGCLDTIREIIATPYGNLNSFFNDYAKEEGIILYLENCEQNLVELYRILISFKLAGWYDNLNGIIFGRNGGPENDKFSYYGCISKVFESADYPVILDADIGHKPPQMTIINGSFASLSVDSGKAVLKQKLI
ncbi:MAG: LD-carboxypeptidase [Bacteriovoracaceae bacterium]|nr:LD-carboxypeptidase [Bacteriovoracaceae bacterium]